jgi:hypothetical protein
MVRIHGAPHVVAVDQPVVAGRIAVQAVLAEPRADPAPIVATVNVVER